MGKKKFLEGEKNVLKVGLSNYLNYSQLEQYYKILSVYYLRWMLFYSLDNKVKILN